MGLDIQQILTQIISFLILLFIMKRFAWKPILNILQERKQKIKEGLDDIEKSKERLEALRKDYEQRLRSIEEEARHKITLAIGEGKAIAGQIQDDARKKSQELLQKTKENLALEIAKAKVELKDEITHLVMETTEKVIGKALDEERQRELVTEFITQISTDTKMQDERR